MALQKEVKVTKEFPWRLTAFCLAWFSFVLTASLGIGTAITSFYCIAKINTCETCLFLISTVEVYNGTVNTFTIPFWLWLLWGLVFGAMISLACWGAVEVMLATTVGSNAMHAYKRCNRCRGIAGFTMFICLYLCSFGPIVGGILASYYPVFFFWIIIEYLLLDLVIDYRDTLIIKLLSRNEGSLDINMCLLI